MSEIVKAENAEVMETTEKQGFFAKVGSAIKKHGKKIAAVAAVIGVGVGAYLLGKNDGLAEANMPMEFEDLDESDEDDVETE